MSKKKNVTDSFVENFKSSELEENVEGISEAVEQTSQPTSKIDEKPEQTIDWILNHRPEDAIRTTAYISEKTHATLKRIAECSSIKLGEYLENICLAHLEQHREELTVLIKKNKPRQLRL